jgi:hypothetical protein
MDKQKYQGHCVENARLKDAIRVENRPPKNNIKSLAYAFKVME